MNLFSKFYSFLPPRGWKWCVFGLFIPLTLILSPAYAGGCLAPKSRIGAESEADKDARLLARIKETLRRAGVNVGQAERLGFPLKVLFEQAYCRTRIDGRVFLHSRYKIAPHQGRTKRLANGEMRFTTSSDKKGSGRVVVASAGSRSVCEAIIYDKDSGVFIVKVGTVTEFRISKNGIITANLRGKGHFPLGSSPPTFMGDDASQAGIASIKGGVGEAVLAGFISLLHPSTNLYYISRLVEREEHAFFYPVFDGGLERSIFARLPVGRRYFDGAAFDEKGDLCGLMEAGAHTRGELKDKFQSILDMRGADNALFRISEEITFFVTGVVVKGENGLLQPDLAEAQELYEWIVKSWISAASTKGLPLPKRIITEDLQLNRRFIFDIRNGRAYFSKASALFSGRALTSSLGRLMEEAYRLRTPLRGGSAPPFGEAAAPPFGEAAAPLRTAAKK